MDLSRSDGGVGEVLAACPLIRLSGNRTVRRIWKVRPVPSTTQSPGIVGIQFTKLTTQTTGSAVFALTWRIWRVSTSNEPVRSQIETNRNRGHLTGSLEVRSRVFEATECARAVTTLKSIRVDLTLPLRRV